MTPDNKKRVLIIDALNAYLRAYIVDPSISANGQPIGGLKGFIKILQKLVRDTRPEEIVIVWDGPNGSRKRKSMDSNYKAGRKPIRLNRAFHNLTDDQEMQNKVWQQSRLIEYINEMPIIQVMLPEIEADDVISYITSMENYSGWQKVIVSNDKDFMQLCDGETILFRPTKKEIMSMNTISENIGIHPTNMALARAIAGDASDNLKGVRGAGLATIAKRLPFLKESRTASIDDVIEYCNETEQKQKFYSNVVEAREVVEHNYNMMQLYAPQMSVQAKQKVDYAITEFECTFNKTEILRLMIEDGFGELNWEDLKASLNKISLECIGQQD
jgi:DNA polymerase-1